MIAGPSVSWPFRVGYRNFLAVHWHRNPYLCSAIFCQTSCWTTTGMDIAGLACPSHLRSCPGQSAYFPSGSEDLTSSCHRRLSPQRVAAGPQPPEVSWLSCSIA
jgi:hypothetical protein